MNRYLEPVPSRVCLRSIERLQNKEKCPENVRTPGEPAVPEPFARYIASCGGEIGGKGSDGGGT